MITFFFILLWAALIGIPIIALVRELILIRRIKRQHKQQLDEIRRDMVASLIEKVKTAKITADLPKDKK